MPLVPEESEGEAFSREFRWRFQTADSMADFYSSQIAAKYPKREGILFGVTGVRGTPTSNRDWRRTREKIIREYEQSHQAAQQFVKADLREIYNRGLREGIGDPNYKPSVADNSAIRRQQDRVNQILDQAMGEARRGLSVPWRDARDHITTNPDVDGQKLGAKVYRNGTHMPLGKYQSMVARSEAQKMWNFGVIRGAEKNKVVAFEVVDGPGCGWESHDDLQQANGMIVNARDAKRVLIAHPNCTRTFIPRPDIQDPPDSTQSGAERAKEAIQKAVDKGKQVFNPKLLAANIAYDLAFDAEQRRFIFNTAVNGVQELAAIQQRMETWLLARETIGPDRRALDLFDEISDEIDDYLETGVAENFSDAAKYVLAESKRVTLTQIEKAAGDFDFLRELTIRADMTHRELNIINAIEHKYGEVIIRRLANYFPDADDLAPAYKAYLERYTPSAVSGKVGKRMADRTRHRLLGKTIGTIQDQTTNRLADYINQQGILSGPGVVSFPRLGRYVDRVDLFGARYNWSTRMVRYETTLVNKIRHLPVSELRDMARAKGLPTEFPKVDADGIFGNVMRAATRKELIRMLGYEKGFLTHLRLNPQGLVRIGFRFDPHYGWKRPLPSISIKPRSLPFRYTARLNRGTLANAADTAEGIRLRNITQEISIVTGRWANLNKIPGVNMPSIFLPGMDRIGVRLKTVLNRIAEGVTPLANADDLRLLIKNRGLSNIIRDTEFMSLFVELRAMGWSWLRVGRTLSLNLEQTGLLARTVRAYFGDYRRELNIMSHMIEAQRLVATGGSPELAFRHYQAAWENVVGLYKKPGIVRNIPGAAWDDVTPKINIGGNRGWTILDEAATYGPGRMDFIRSNVFEQAKSGWDELLNYYELQGVDVTRYRGMQPFGRMTNEVIESMQQQAISIARSQTSFGGELSLDQLSQFVARMNPKVVDSWHHVITARAQKSVQDVWAQVRKTAARIRLEASFAGDAKDLWFKELKATPRKLRDGYRRWMLKQQIDNAIYAFGQDYSDMGWEDVVEFLQEGAGWEFSELELSDIEYIFSKGVSKTLSPESRMIREELYKHVRSWQLELASQVHDLTDPQWDDVVDSVLGKRKIVWGKLKDTNSADQMMAEFRRLQEKYPRPASRVGYLGQHVYPADLDQFTPDQMADMYGLSTRQGFHRSGEIIRRASMTFSETADEIHWADFELVPHPVREGAMARAFVINDARSLMTHEFGHQLGYLVDDITRYWADDIQPVTNTLFKNKGFMTGSQRVVHRAMSELYPELDDVFDWEEVIIDELSAYAATNVDETIAEAFAMVELRGDDASPLARKIYEIIMEILEEFESDVATGRIDKEGLKRIIPTKGNLRRVYPQ